MASDPDFQKRLGKARRRLREARGLSLMDVVKNHDITLSHLQKIERGALDPRASTLRKLADAYGVTLSELLDGV